MKVAMTSSGGNLAAPLDSRFGRAARFLIYDTDGGTLTVLDNRDNAAAAQGAGIQAAKTIVDSGTGALITGNCGPKAFQALSAAGIKVYSCNAATCREALEMYRSGALTALEAPQRGG